VELRSWPRWGPRLVVLLACAGPATRTAVAQVRGLPFFNDATYSFDTRTGVDVGDGGELGGFTWVASATHLFQTGNCKRPAVSAGIGSWSPSGATSGGVNLGASVSYLVNPCPYPQSAPTPAIRLAAGAGVTWAEGRSFLNVPLGVQVGQPLDVPVFRVEPWVTVRGHYLESPRTEGSSTWRLGVSLGLDLSMQPKEGPEPKLKPALRAAADFGTGRTGWGGGLSLWW
jgi:hypothetical protein